MGRARPAWPRPQVGPRGRWRGEVHASGPTRVREKGVGGEGSRPGFFFLIFFYFGFFKAFFKMILRTNK